MKHQSRGLGLLLSFLIGVMAYGDPEARQEVVLLHTNDLHSHFLPDGGPLNLGGVARLKTAVSELRTRYPHALLLDGGDWSEGNVFFVPSGGLDTLKMMKHVGYDAIVVGNHDWLNGPDHLLDIAQTAKAQGLSPQLLGANIKFQNYKQAADFKKAIPPFVIKTIPDQNNKPVRVALIGFLTEDKIYQSYLKPIEITDTVDAAKEVIEQLKGQADLFVGISHNNIKVNAELLKKVPELDIIIGAHDHLKLTTAIEVTRTAGFSKRPGWIVETGSWGRYLGEVRLEIKTSSSWSGAKREVALKKYQLHQIDSRYRDDVKTAQMVYDLQQKIELALGPVFHDHICENEIELNHDGAEAPIGNFATDAYRQIAPEAELAVDQGAFIYGDLHPGNLRSVDFFNSNPGVYNIDTQKTWTIKTLPIQGYKLKWILNLLLTSSQLRSKGGVSLSGANLIYSKWFHSQDAQDLQSVPFEDLSLLINPQADLGGIAPIEAIWINGQPLEGSRSYKVALSGGAYEAIEFVNSIVSNFFPLQGLKDTGVEAWKAMLQYGKRMGRITADQVFTGDRVRTLEPDLTFEPFMHYWDRSKRQISFSIKNMGATPSQAGATVRVFVNENGTDLGREPKLRELTTVTRLLPLTPGETQTLTLDVALPNPDTRALWIKIDDSLGELNTFNNETILWLKH